MMANKWKIVISGAVLLLFFSPAVNAQAITFERIKFEDTQVTLLRVPVNGHRLNFLPTARLVSQSVSSQAGMRALSRLLPNSTGAYALISGGFSGEDELVPAGSLVIDDEDYSPPIEKVRVRGKGAPEYELSGVLCVTRPGQIVIKPIRDYFVMRAVCASALQAGPLLAGPKSYMGADLPQDVVERLVACKPLNNLNFFDFYYFRPIPLARIRKFIEANCEAALNLAGGHKAGVSLWSQSGELAEYDGELDATIPSAIFIRKNSTSREGR